MPTLLGPFNIGYPVLFRSGGDTVTEAFGKHIQEIERIYGILNTLDSGKLSTPDMLKYLNEHNTNAQAHRNLQLPFENITGNLDGARIINNIPNATIPAGNVIGKLINATIDVDKINGLADYLAGQEDGNQLDDKGDGIVDKALSDNGYIKFGNGLIIQWSKVTSTTLNSSNNLSSGTFVKNFSSACYLFLARPSEVAVRNLNDYKFEVYDYSASGFTVRYSNTNANDNNPSYSAVGVSYLAIGV